MTVSRYLQGHPPLVTSTIVAGLELVLGMATAAWQRSGATARWKPSPLPSRGSRTIAVSQQAPTLVLQPPESNRPRCCDTNAGRSRQMDPILRALPVAAGRPGARRHRDRPPGGHRYRSIHRCRRPGFPLTSPGDRDRHCRAGHPQKEDRLQSPTDPTNQHRSRGRGRLRRRTPHRDRALDAITFTLAVLAALLALAGMQTAATLADVRTHPITKAIFVALEASESPDYQSP